MKHWTNPVTGQSIPVADLHGATLCAAAVAALQGMLRSSGINADALAVVQAHVAAVRTGDPELMAADYAPQALITRGLQVVAPRAYFPGVVQRLEGSRLVVSAITVAPPTGTGPDVSTVTMHWQLAGGRANRTCGTDTFVVRADRIVQQTVVLHAADF